MSQQVSINEFMLDISGDVPRLVGGRCKDCGNVTFPYLTGCAKCAGSDMEIVRLGTEGTLWGWTVQGFPPKSPPYLGENHPAKFEAFGVGYVELPEVIVEARLTESTPEKLREGMKMEMVLEPLFTDESGNEVVTYAFAPVE
ncbi:MAG: OB-fold domain-containing protein [Pseudomonadota bacterium]